MRDGDAPMAEGELSFIDSCLDRKMTTKTLVKSDANTTKQKMVTQHAENTNTNERKRAHGHM